MNPKVLLVILLLLVALFVASLGLGIRGSRGEAPLTPNLNAPWLQRLHERVTKKLTGQDLRVGGEADSGCLVGDEQLQAPVEATCTFVIVPDRSTRRMRLKLAYGRAARLSLAQEGAPTVDGERLAAGEPAKAFAILPDEEARLTLTGCAVDQDDRLGICLVSLE
jgi:hypothetical protein